LLGFGQGSPAFCIEVPEFVLVEDETSGGEALGGRVQIGAKRA
jgi:hypothetical protein